MRNSEFLGKGAFKHFHAHLKDPRCVGGIKQTLLDYAKNSMMELMKSEAPFERKSPLHTLRAKLVLLIHTIFNKNYICFNYEK